MFFIISDLGWECNDKSVRTLLGKASFPFNFWRLSWDGLRESKAHSIIESVKFCSRKEENQMEKLWKFVLAGIAAAIGGMFVSSWIGDLFNGMDYGSATVLGICLYLCVVIVTCTGMILLKLEKNAGSNKSRND